MADELTDDELTPEEARLCWQCIDLAIRSAAAGNAIASARLLLGPAAKLEKRFEKDEPT